jgi:hypothetical protein
LPWFVSFVGLAKRPPARGFVQAVRAFRGRFVQN